MYVYFFKNYYKLSALLAVMVLFIGFMVSGCSSSNIHHADNDPAEVGAGIDVIVGLADKSSAKGFDIDSKTTKLIVSLLDSANKAVGYQIPFAAEATKTVKAWSVLDNQSLLLHVDIAAENVDRVASVIVIAVDEDNHQLGLLANDSVTLKADQITTVDFVADGAPAFIPVAELIDTAALIVTTKPAAQQGELTIAAGQKARVSVYIVVKLTEKLTVYDKLSVVDYMMNSNSANIKIENNIIEGLTKAEEPAVVTVTLNIGEKVLTANLDVIVTDAILHDTVIEIKVAPEGTIVESDEAYNNLPTKVDIHLDKSNPMIVIGKVTGAEGYTYEVLDEVEWSLQQDYKMLAIDENGVVTALYGAQGGYPATVKASYWEGEEELKGELTVVGAFALNS